MATRNMTVTIASGDTASGEINIDGWIPTKLHMPAAFTGTTVTFTGATEIGGTYNAVQDGAGNSITKTVAASKVIKISPSDLAGIKALKVVSGSSEGAARILTLSCIS